MASPDAAVRHYEQQLRQIEATLTLVRRQWRTISPSDDFETAWAKIAARLTLLVRAGMVGAATAGAAYVPEVLGEETPVQVVPKAFAESASDGRPLDSLLYGGIIRARTLLGSGLSAPDALRAGGAWLETLAQTQVADAARGAAGVAITATPNTGYVRLVSPPCCQRCAVLAGKFFKWNEGFLRHPRCDCRHVPARSDRANPEGLSPRPSVEEIKDLTRAQRRAIGDGADQKQVINSHRAGNRSKDKMTTSVGTSRHGYYTAKNRAAGIKRNKPRLTPEGVYKVARSREEAIEMLKKYAYIL